MRQLKITKQITNRESFSLEKYLQEIAKVDMITPDEEVTLTQKIKAGDNNALNKLVRSNLRFVISVAKQYQNQGISLPDLINEGNIGLIKAAKRYDETRGFKFISYAVWWIRQAIMQAITDNSRVVRLPQNKIGSISKIHKAYQHLEQLYEREPTTYEIADLLEVEVSEVKDAMANATRSISVDSPLSSDDRESGTFLDVISDKNLQLRPDLSLMAQSLVQEIERSFATLSYRESYILTLYFGIGGSKTHTLEEIGEKIELTRERVRQIKEKSLKKLKHTSRSKLLKMYLG